MTRIMAEALVCEWCGHIDDLAADESGEQTLRCPCPHDEVTAQVRLHEAQRRYRAAVIRARQHDQWRNWKAS